jgi:hypothetical protein
MLQFLNTFFMKKIDKTEPVLRHPIQLTKSQHNRKKKQENRRKKVEKYRDFSVICLQLDFTL